jgi:hypothetical protein
MTGFSVIIFVVTGILSNGFSVNGAASGIRIGSQRQVSRNTTI